MKGLKNQLEKLKAQQTAANAKLIKMYKDRLDGFISDQEYSLFRNVLVTEEQDISQRVSDLEKQIETLSVRKEHTENQRAIIEKYTRFIGEVLEIGERNILIHWKI